MALPLWTGAKLVCPACLEEVQILRTMRVEYKAVAAQRGGETGFHGYVESKPVAVWADEALPEDYVDLQIICGGTKGCGRDWVQEDYEKAGVTWQDKRYPQCLLDWRKEGS